MPFVERIKFNPEINLGHVLSTLAFIGVGITLYTSIVTNINDLSQWRAAMEKLDIPKSLEDSAVREQRVKTLEETSRAQLTTNQKILDKLGDLDSALAVVSDRLERQSNGDKRNFAPR